MKPTVLIVAATMALAAGACGADGSPTDSVDRSPYARGSDASTSSPEGPGSESQAAVPSRLREASLEEWDSGVDLVWYVAGGDGRPLAARQEDRAINPASVVKVATTLWALDRLGPDHRFETRFGIRGELDPRTGVLDGDLVVRGGADPDFHVENAVLVAEALNRIGLREVRGSLIVSEDFWIGWEGGSARTERDAAIRGRKMAARLREAFDPSLWDTATRRSIEEFFNRRGRAAELQPRLAIRGTAGAAGDGASLADRWLVVHRSNPLRYLLRRFNAFSNNDIERLGRSLGTASELAAELTRRWGPQESPIELATLSGLGANRLTPRQIVLLLEELRESAAAHRLDVRQLLPVAGCDPGTLEPFPRLADADISGALVAKTGTLTTTDGGVTVLAGWVETIGEPLVFAVAAPRIGTRRSESRDEQARWLLLLVSRLGGARSVRCGDPLPFSDDEAEVAAVSND